ncbi:MAG: hypothetical protein IJC36_00055, partial [Clostridia bacterium]|nr:hypothetical protein [Clostridia bacterium]
TFTASISTNSGNKFVAQFTASETSYHLVFRDYDATVTNITLSNFVLTAVKTLTEADLAGNAIADGTWKATNGSVTNNTKAHTVTATGLSYHSIYTTISGLTPNTVYQLTFDMSANTGFKQLWMVPGSETLDLGGNTYPQNSSTFRATLGTEGTKFLAEFTANEASYHLVFRDYDATVTNITLSNFALTAVRTLSEAEIAGNDIANNGAWDVTKNASGTVTKSKGTVKFTGAQYQDVSLPLTDLEANTTYTLSFINSSSGIELFANTVYVIPGETTYAESLKSKEGTVVYSCEASNKVNDEGAIVTTVRFTTDDTNTNYLIVFHNDNVSEVTLSNFEFSYETAYEFAGTAIRTASEDATQAMRFKNTISKDLLANGYNGKEVVEYGTLAAFEANLVTDFTYENVDGLRIKKGVSYDKANSINVVFAEDDVDVTYTAALTNIKTRFYGLDMKVCSYMVLSDGSVIYGDLQTISVYGIMNAILNGDNDDDKAVVNAMLEDEAVLNGYNAWLAK